jgi:hypothetical protein
MDFLQEDTVATQWFWRIVATLAIATAYHWWSSPDRSIPDVGNRLQAEWNVKQPSAPQEEARNPRTALLDRLEKEANTKEIVFGDDIEDEAEENLVREQTKKVKASAPPEELDAPTPPRRVARAAPPAPVMTAPKQPLPIKATHGHHPGITGFRRWYDTEASLYRIYTVGKSDGELVHPPFIPKSERGHVALKLRVTNKYRRTMSAYWVDYQGKEIHKGNVSIGGIFHQTTW